LKAFFPPARFCLICLLAAQALVFDSFVFAQDAAGTSETSGAPDLSLGSGDLWVSQGADGGFHLYIRKKPDIASVLLTETTKDPALLEPNYAYRTIEWNAVNGDELRLLDGRPLAQHGSWALVDSTPEFLPEAGTDVFHIYIPYVLHYGYPETRHGVVAVGNGTFLNIRAFALPYADYRGAFKDNPFVLDLVQEPLEGPPEANYMKDTKDAFERITQSTGGSLFHSTGPDDVAETVRKVIETEAANAEGNGALDLVICLDTTASMKNDIAALKQKLLINAEDLAKAFYPTRLGLLLYRDYPPDEYITKIFPFTNDLNVFQKSLNSAKALGGKDIPEAVDEALYDAITKYPWSEDATKMIILVGDAPPHPIPRGDITEDMVTQAAEAASIEIHAIILPQ